MSRSISDILGDDSALESDPSELIVDRYALAKVLGVAPSTINRLAANGDIRKSGPGKFRLGEAVQGYLATKSGEAPTSDKARKLKAEADLAEAKAAAASGELVPAVEVQREWESILRDVRASMLAVASRVRARLPSLTTADVAAIDQEVRAALTNLGESNA